MSINLDLGKVLYEQAILEISDNIKTSIDNNEMTCGLFWDFSKAFDTVNHQILLSKLYTEYHWLGLVTISLINFNLSK